MVQNLHQPDHRFKIDLGPFSPQPDEHFSPVPLPRPSEVSEDILSQFPARIFSPPPGGLFGHRRRSGARLVAHARLRRRWKSLWPRSSEVISVTASFFLASALAMAILARWTAEREMSVTPEIIRTLKPAPIRS
jgi:hypothetical protein